jgi:hypothetical protein
MITGDDEEMGETSGEGGDVDEEQPIIDLDDFDYDQFLLDYQAFDEEKPEEGDIESAKQCECYLTIQDPEPT